MNDQAIQADPHAAPAACENCAAPLHGTYCHDCGQSRHNPIRHFGHAIEEFFEAFWHLDGRVFRTLRDLLVPGRVAIGYLAGHRARYIAPLRLFVVLSVLTFFVGAAAVHVEGGSMQVDGLDALGAATTVEEVRRLEDALLAEIEEGRAARGNAPGVDPILIAAEARIRGVAANRIVELRGGGAAGLDDPTGNEGDARVEPGPDPAGPDGAAAGQAAIAATGQAPAAAPEQASRLQLNILGHRGYWDMEDNPLAVRWLPGFANDWLNRKVGNLEKNLQTLDQSTADTWLQAVMSAAPTALFLLVPVFAVLLKVFYLFTKRLYLEHLVVALYSHAFLLVTLMLVFVAKALGDWAGATPFGILFDIVFWAALLWMPVYLLVMQRRAYGQAWWLTILKYLVIGYIYFWLLGIATLLIFLSRLTAA